ncbi:aldehyde dehydrogenase family protein [Mycobacterium sp. Aquia_216]|uniref:aldehyde dehydrogenase family protein n=1 Tax=Mycobacterium sp. Aquia_216 TaxID=2991729 RepID=UPI00227B2845|nr:aldehyde dehydrogenase family protein [Mycobacterium sp. Aquia_216]WAJ46230.1 aldehyde dehydrogenase family protein [Mycobacterium sp. Aquia_216]
MPVYQQQAARWVSDDPAGSFAVYEPATGAKLADFVLADEAAVDAAVRDAHAAFVGGWGQTTARERALLLREAARVLREHSDEIAEIECREVGKPWEIARNFDLVGLVESFEFFASVVADYHGAFFPGGPIDTYTVKEPYGVVAGIIPFNWPPAHVGAKLAPPLAAGNTVILKPPEQCPLSVLRIVELLEPIFPENVVQALPGTGAVTGKALVSHPLVRRVTFTGSPDSGRSILKSIADNLTGAMLELGGKDPFIVFADADLNAAVEGALEGSLFNQGEACTSASRLLVHESLADEFTQRYIAAVSKLVIGNGLDRRTQIGALVSREHMQRVRGYIDIGKSDGATVAFEGQRPTDPELADGYFVPPVIFTDVTPDMRIAREEIFGPVISILTFTRYDEAIEIANSTEFALVAGVFTSDELVAKRAGRDIDAGVVMINNYNRGFVGIPFGGNRASGFGREHAASTLDEFARIKSVRYRSGRSELPIWSGADTATDGRVRPPVRAN